MVSEITSIEVSARVAKRLNPCSCGGWSQRLPSKCLLVLLNRVLILVLVEDGLRVLPFVSLCQILPLCLNPCSCGGWSQSQEKAFLAKRNLFYSLNPCSCGGWSQREAIVGNRVYYTSLNPCSCGGWSQREAIVDSRVYYTNVLILVLVEDGLRDVYSTTKEINNFLVLILVLVEDGLRDVRHEGEGDFHGWS